MDELEALIPNKEEYLPRDKYHDFRKIFTGTPEGERVFREILAWGRMFKPSIVASPVDPYMMAMKAGERNMALRLLYTVNNEPSELPTNTTRKKHG